jgi:hypothetical protein
MAGDSRKLGPRTCALKHLPTALDSWVGIELVKAGTPTKCCLSLLWAPWGQAAGSALLSPLGSASSSASDCWAKRDQAESVSHRMEGEDKPTSLCELINHWASKNIGRKLGFGSYKPRCPVGQSLETRGFFGICLSQLEKIAWGMSNLWRESRE